MPENLDLPATPKADAPPPPLELPSPEFAEAFMRQAISLCLKAAQEPARVAAHNQAASRIVTMRGVQPMQEIHPLQVIQDMLVQLLQAQAACLNYLLALNGSTPELRPIPPSDNGDQPPQDKAT